MYDRIYSEYRALYCSLRPNFNRIAQLSHPWLVQERSALSERFALSSDNGRDTPGRTILPHTPIATMRIQHLFLLTIIGLALNTIVEVVEYFMTPWQRNFGNT